MTYYDRIVSQDSLTIDFRRPVPPLEGLKGSEWEPDQQSGREGVPAINVEEDSADRTPERTRI